jgi:hypothetical protein
MDSAIPIGRWRIGLDGLLGLVPGLGDTASAMISLLIVPRAMQAGLPQIAIARMVANIGIDALVGAVPVVGDLFDFGYKANMKNAAIYREALRSGHRGNVRHWLFFVGVALAGFGIVMVPIVGIVFLARLI